jgi:hypothetical protein
MYRLVVLVCFAAFVLFTVQGLRNRPGPRWLAIAGLPALAATIMSDWWRISAGCYSAGSVKLLFVWAAIVSLMFLHQAVQPRPRSLDGISPASKGFSWALACRGIFQVLVFLPIAWSILNEFRDNRHVDNTTAAQAAIIAIQNSLGWATFVLFLLGAAVGFYGRIIRLRSATRV